MNVSQTSILIKFDLVKIENKPIMLPGTSIQGIKFESFSPSLSSILILFDRPQQFFLLNESQLLYKELRNLIGKLCFENIFATVAMVFEFFAHS